MITPEDYECALLEKLRLDFRPAAVCVFGTENGRLHEIQGRYSLVNRQLDAAAYRLGASRPFFIADAKRHARRLDVKHAEAFLGMVDDVGADLGLLVAPVGFTDAAVRRTAAASSKVQIMTLEQALTFKWLPLARQIFPHDWVFLKELALAVRRLHEKESPDQVIDALEPVAFEEWDAFVEYALRHHHAEAIDFLRTIAARHADEGWRFNAASHLRESGNLAEHEAGDLLSREIDPDVRGILERVL
jgi:hypothetical protein